MNGVHDMGGMHGLGPVEIEPDEPVFHADWEARVLALTLAVAAWGRWNIDASRHAREQIPGPDYLAMTYYEKWLAGLVSLIERSGLLSESDKTPALTADRVPAALARGGPTSRDVAAPLRFRVGDKVRARNLNPPGHTRLPRYVRGHLGVVDRDHGPHVLPDANAHFLGERPERLYGVRFTARELWGHAGVDSVHLDLWDGYLDLA